MTVYAISDLHLSSGDKPMDIFGAHWARHFARIREDWLSRVGGEDIVLLPGDLSWAMTLGEAREHLDEIGALPGRKILLKGNHDYWWSSVQRVREALAPGCYALQNDALLLDGLLFAGSRGWLLPGPDSPAADKKIYARELIRLDMSLKAARALSAEAPLICLMHYPPLTEAQGDTGFTEIIERYGARCVVYGHLHGQAVRGAFRGPRGGARYFLASCDALDFKLLQIAY